MSHIGNKLKAGFFATPERQGEYLYKLLDVQHDGAWFDPTCGEGCILNQLAESRQVDIIKYGVELDKGRATKASDVLDRCINAPIESMVIQNDAFGLVFLNPPYDSTIKGIEDSRAERKEYLELVRNTRYLKEGGVMIYVIPSYRFADSKIARFLSNQFENIGLLRFSDEDYDDFRQCVLIGTKKKGKFKDFNKKLFDFLMQMDQEDFVKQSVTPLDVMVGQHQWKVPSSPLEPRTFYTKIERKSDYYEAIRSSKGMEQFMARSKTKQLEIGGRPILPLNQGQMALLLASGAVNGLLGEKDDLHLVQGLEIVSKIKEEEEKVHESGAVTKITKERTKRDISVKLITPKGLIRKLV